MPSSERVQKLIANAGLASRREAEELIRDGQVTINGRVAKLGDHAKFGKDAIKVRGKLIHWQIPKIYFAFHKPKQVLCIFGDDDKRRKTLEPYFAKVKAKIFPIGRLDFLTDGLVLLTNDGKIAESIRRSKLIPRGFEVKIKGLPTAEQFEKMKNHARIHSIKIEKKHQSKSKLNIVVLGMAEFDLKAHLAKFGFSPEKLSQISIGQIRLKDLAPGKHRPLRETQLQALIEHPELGLK